MEEMLKLVIPACILIESLPTGHEFVTLWLQFFSVQYFVSYLSILCQSMTSRISLGIKTTCLEGTIM